MILYKRNAKGKPIFWKIKDIDGAIEVNYGLVGKEGHTETYRNSRPIADEIKSQIAAKRKDGYKEIRDLFDNAPDNITITNNLIHYLNTYLPEFNTHEDGAFIPMLCKTLEDNKPFTKNTYFGEWKINGERCIITATKTDDLFQEVHLKYRSRKGIDWTDKLSYLDNYILPCISKTILEMMLEEDVALDGELYLPGYGINEINSFIKNTELPQHYQLQFWCYDLAIDDMSAITRYYTLEANFHDYIGHFDTKEQHLSNNKNFVLLPKVDVIDITSATKYRDAFIDLGFEGLVVRDNAANYQFGGRRNMSMMKYKRIEDGHFTIIDIVPEGIKRSNLPKFICRNDINDELFECTINKPQDVQEAILLNKNNFIGKAMLVEYRERSGIKQVPFHAKGINIIL